jgi:hypothetical protein
MSTKTKDSSINTLMVDLMIAATAAHIPAIIESVDVSIDVEFNPSRGPPYIRKRVRCPLAHHPNCFKWRNVNMGGTQMNVVGFLGCWLQNGRHYADRASHMNMRPSPAAVQLYLDSCGLAAE